ncbi:MAG: sortase [Propionibacteriales bacterium]|nr:sortase [Propionibacteriales bacterium]
MRTREHATRTATVSKTLGIALSALSALSALTACSGAGPAPAVPPQPVTVVATGPAPRHVGRPTRVQIPAIGVDEALHGVGLTSAGAMQTPDFGDAGWYDLGPRPGARGPAVIVAHVHGPAGDDVFAELDELEPGDRVTVRRTDGTTVFIVDAVEQTRKETLPTRRIWNETDQAVLRLITCGGEPDPVTRMYPDNTVVYAHAVG